MRDGNYLYGAFGHDFATRDGRRVMIVALTDRQWDALLEVTGLREPMSAIAEAIGVDLDTESGRYEGRDMIAALLRPWFEARGLPEIRAAFEGTGVSWGPYQTFRQLVTEDPRCSTDNAMWSERRAPGRRQLPDARHAAGVLAGGAHAGAARAAARRAHRAGAGRPALPDATRDRPPLEGGVVGLAASG